MYEFPFAAAADVGDVAATAAATALPLVLPRPYALLLYELPVAALFYFLLLFILFFSYSAFVFVAL